MLSKKVGGEHVCVKKGDYAEILVPCDSRISMEMEKESKYWPDSSHSSDSASSFLSKKENLQYCLALDWPSWPPRLFEVITIHFHD